MPDVMEGFPPEPSNQVTLANWRTAPYARWAFHHVREIIPSARIATDADRRGAFEAREVDLSNFTVAGVDGAPLDMAAYLAATATSGMMVLKDGRQVFAVTTNGLTLDTPHILMSVSKSVLGLVAGALVDDGTLDPEAEVTRYVPEVADTAFAGARVRDLLDMRVGIEFDEDYLRTDGPIIAYRKATNWNPLEPGETATDLRAFFSSLTARDGDHGAAFHYVSPNTDLMAWVIERASGERYADVLSSRLWKPMGASDDAYITVDRLGAPRGAGGVCVSLRDLARLGQLLVDDGNAFDGRRVVSRDWIVDIETAGDRQAWAAGDFAAQYGDVAMHYRSKWYVRRPTGAAGAMMFGVGIHGQHVFVDRAERVVVAKVAAQTQPLDPDLKQLNIRAATALIDLLRD
ncbi:MAG: serine hydrolase [Pseudomonadota bacterium]